MYVFTDARCAMIPHGDRVKAQDANQRGA